MLNQLGAGRLRGTIAPCPRGRRLATRPRAVLQEDPKVSQAPRREAAPTWVARSASAPTRDEVLSLLRSVGTIREQDGVMMWREQATPTISRPTSPAAAPAPPGRADADVSVSTGEQVVAYFAYGANMNPLTLLKRGVKIVSRDPARVHDSSVVLAFKHRGGYATLEQVAPKSGTQPRNKALSSQVHGVLYRLTKTDLRKLQKREGGYQLQKVQVETYDGHAVEALAFVSGAMSKLAAEVAPTEAYMRLLRDGAGDNYLDPLYQAWLSGIETVPSTGLPAEYFETPAKYIGYSFLAAVGLLTTAFYMHAF